jgi:transcriptional regulator with XRE-family HTH domain
MELYWPHIWKRKDYQRATVAERRLIEIRFSLARAVRARRKGLRLKQAQLARIVGADPATISRLERASRRVSLDFAFLVLIATDATDEEIADAVNASARRDVWELRWKMARRLAQVPLPGVTQSRRRRRASFPAPQRMQLEPALALVRYPGTRR